MERVYKKSCADDALVVYLASRNLHHRAGRPAYVDGAITMDASMIKGKRVFACVVAKLRLISGEEELRALGLAPFGEIWSSTQQVYPAKEPRIWEPSQFHRKIDHKLDAKTFPFFIEIPDMLPSSMTIMSAPTSTRKRKQMCGLEYKLIVYVASKELETEEAEATRFSVPMQLTKTELAARAVESPLQESCSKSVLSGTVSLSVSLPKKTFADGVSIPVTVHMTNQSKKVIRELCVQVRQHTVVVVEGAEGIDTRAIVAQKQERLTAPVLPGTTSSHTLAVTPGLTQASTQTTVTVNNRASGTLVENAPPQQLATTGRFELGNMVSVSYDVKVTAYLSGALSTHLSARLPVEIRLFEDPTQPCSQVPNYNAKAVTTSHTPNNCHQQARERFDSYLQSRVDKVYD
eukprot:m.48477 g.48477  ORF g.48477 m.48477 type:complete len:404 (+) comp12001_c1_seq2:165-1376(+)